MILPAGAPGLVSFNGSDYRLSYHGEPGEILGYRLVNVVTGNVYDLDNETLSCDCPDATYRDRCCKHALCITELRRRGDVV